MVCGDIIGVSLRGMWLRRLGTIAGQKTVCDPTCALAATQTAVIRMAFRTRRVYMETLLIYCRGPEGSRTSSDVRLPASYGSHGPGEGVG